MIGTAVGCVASRVAESLRSPLRVVPIASCWRACPSSLFPVDGWPLWLEPQALGVVWSGCWIPLCAIGLEVEVHSTGRSWLR